VSATDRPPNTTATPVPERILVVRTGAIGDVVNALVFAGLVKRAAPDTTIGWVVHPLSAPLVSDHPHVDRVHLWNKADGLAGFRALVREVRGERYGLAVDLQRIAKSALLARLSGAPRRLGFDRARTKELSWLLTNERIPGGPDHEHMVERYRAFARHLGCDGDPVHTLPHDADAERTADELVRELGGAPIALNLGASKPSKRWRPERYGELAAHLVAHGRGPIVTLGGPGDRALADALATTAGGAVHDLVGRTSLRETIAVLRRARVLVTGDTGPMHLAVAVGTPTLALFGPTDPLRVGPFGFGHEPGERHTVLAVDAPGAGRSSSGGGAPDDFMDGLGVDAVCDALFRKLDALDTCVEA